MQDTRVRRAPLLVSLVALAALVFGSGFQAADTSLPAPPVATPRLVYNGPPVPDPGLGGVGDCVWTRLAPEIRADLARPEDGSAVYYDFSTLGGRASVLQLEHNTGVLDAVRACDPRLTAHWRYSFLAVAAKVWRETALARLSQLPGRGRRPVDQAALERAWLTAPEGIREALVHWVNRSIDRVLNRDGGFSDCRAIAEAPAGAGFGEATVMAMRRVRVRLSDGAGPKPGVRFQLVVNWRLG